jgi:hypothetical protein
MQSATPGASFWLVQGVKSQLNLDDFEKMSNIEDFYNWWENNHRRFWEGDFVKYNTPYGFLRLSTQRARLIDSGNAIMNFETSESVENTHVDSHIHNSHTGGTSNCGLKVKQRALRYAHVTDIDKRKW